MRQLTSALLTALALTGVGCKFFTGKRQDNEVPPSSDRSRNGGNTRDVSFGINVNVQREGRAAAVSYLDIRNLIQTRCVSCHGQAGNLNLSVYPFTKPGRNQLEIADDILKSVVDPIRPMPPPPAARLKDDEIALLRAWRDGGALAAPRANSTPAPWLDTMVIKLEWPGDHASWPWNGTGIYSGQAGGLVVGENLDFTLSALGENGEPVVQKNFFAVPIGASGDLSFAIEVAEADLKAHRDDQTAPIPGEAGAVEVFEVKDSSFRISFAPASDNQTKTADLRYAVYVAESRQAVANPDRAAKEARLVQDWTVGANPVTIDGLSAGKTYFVLVVTRDRRGNRAAYQLIEQKVVNDPTPPVVRDGRLTISQVTDAGALVTWSAASDAITEAGKLRYQVLSVHSGAELAVRSNLVGKTRIQLKGLHPQTGYTIKVNAIDGAGNKTAYALGQFRTPGGSGELNHLAYAQQCAERLGRLKPMNCLEGTIIPISVNGRVLSPNLTSTQARSYNFGYPPNQQSCDRPAFLELGAQGQCIPYARVMRVDSYRADGSKHPDVDSLLLCRRYTARLGRHSWRGQAYDGSEFPGFEDVAIIQHNRVTGETCWFQSLAPLGEAKDARRVPPPDEATLPPGTPSYAERSESFWLSPTEAARRDCVKCHDSDPWVHTPYIDEARRPDGTPVVYSGIKNETHRGLYSIVGSRHFPEWTMPRGINVAPVGAGGVSCTSCHALGNRETCARWIAHSIGRVYPPNLSSYGQGNFVLSHWMPPPSGNLTNTTAWNQAGWGQAAERLLACCNNPNAAGCSTRNLMIAPPPLAAD